MTLSITALNTFTLKVVYTDCHKEAHYAECRYAESHGPAAVAQRKTVWKSTEENKKVQGSFPCLGKNFKE